MWWQPWLFITSISSCMLHQRKHKFIIHSVLFLSFCNHCSLLNHGLSFHISSSFTAVIFHMDHFLCLFSVCPPLILSSHFFAPFLLQSSGQQIPVVVESCIRFINLHGESVLRYRNKPCWEQYRPRKWVGVCVRVCTTVLGTLSIYEHAT